MTSAQMPSFDLAEEMFETLRQELGPEQLRAGLDKALGADGSEAASKKYFQEFGRRWMTRVIEEGEKHTDQTYETLKAAAAKTGALAFPYIPQRFIEIAYLGTQPIYTLPIVENSIKGLVFKMPFCEYFKAVGEARGQDYANELHCEDACETACKLAFEHFGFPVRVSMEARMPAEGFCQFAIRKA